MARLLFHVALGFTACLLRSSTVHCSLCAPLEFKIDTLRSPAFWWFETESKYCYETPSVLWNSTKCIFMFAVCKPVMQVCPAESGVCQAAEVNVKGYKFYSLPLNQGRYNDYKFNPGRNYFNVSYMYASVFDWYNIEVDFIRTTIMFKCNPGSKWNTSQSHKPLKDPPGPQAPAPVEIVMVNKSDTIEYTFVFNSSEGCRIGGPGPGPGGDTFLPGSLSVGSILLILFFPSVFLYCFIGVLINCGAGKTGKEVIPNSGFWRNLPGLIMDGFGFCIGKLTCQEMTSTTESYNRM